MTWTILPLISWSKLKKYYTLTGIFFKFPFSTPYFFENWVHCLGKQHGQYCGSWHLSFRPKVLKQRWRWVNLSVRRRKLSKAERANKSLCFQTSQERGVKTSGTNVFPSKTYSLIHIEAKTRKKDRQTHVCVRRAPPVPRVPCPPSRRRGPSKKVEPRASPCTRRAGRLLAACARRRRAEIRHFVGFCACVISKTSIGSDTVSGARSLSMCGDGILSRSTIFSRARQYEMSNNFFLF